MIIVKRYQANDGSEWAEASKADARDRLIAAVEQAMAPLGKRPSLPGCGFENGGGYVQHEPGTVTTTKAQLLALLAVEFPTYGFDKLDAAKVHPMSMVGRVADEAPRPLSNAWHRICCIDTDGREWGQPYYTSHQSEAKQVQLAAVFP